MESVHLFSLRVIFIVFTLYNFLLFSDPSWASINRAVLLCHDCCTVHRSLGRHISQVKSLKKGDWNAIQLAVSASLLKIYLFFLSLHINPYG